MTNRQTIKIRLEENDGETITYVEKSISQDDFENYSVDFNLRDIVRELQEKMP